MRRIEKLEKMLQEAYYTKKNWERLTAEECAMVYRFIDKNDHLDYNEWAHLVNRMFLDGYGWPKTKNWTRVTEILSDLNKTVEGCYGYTGEKRWAHNKN